MKKRQTKNQATLPLEYSQITLLPKWEKNAEGENKPIPIEITLNCSSLPSFPQAFIHWQAPNWGVEGHIPLTQPLTVGRNSIGYAVLPALVEPMTQPGLVKFRLVGENGQELAMALIEISS